MTCWKVRIGKPQTRVEGQSLSVVNGEKTEHALLHGHIHPVGLTYMNRVLEHLKLDQHSSPIDLASAGKYLINFAKSDTQKKRRFIRKHRIHSPGNKKYRLECVSFSNRFLGIQWKLIRGMKDGRALELAYGYLSWENQAEVFERFRNAGVEVSHLIEDVDDVWESKRIIDQMKKQETKP